MKYLMLTLLFIVGCTRTSVLTKEDIEMAQCLCKRDNSVLRVAIREDSKLLFTCEDRIERNHPDNSYSEGCSK